MLATLEQGEQSGAIARLADDLPLFSVLAEDVAPAAIASEVEAALDEVNADDLSPKDALELIYRLKGLLSGSGKT